mmetsp:Transcript_19632/g.29185  ORF Transcript_19632/g.29185 Transcript_19632/m.29185 type:complete len:83 (+) Transcript_19632:2077-2325(+)
MLLILANIMHSNFCQRLNRLKKQATLLDLVAQQQMSFTVCLNSSDYVSVSSSSSSSTGGIMKKDNGSQRLHRKIGISLEIKA